eukprot:TRINITY_DN230_c1_g2_i1.p1 TRINITY_DN230_c1_g2~~TRINITY_DN230_c1_g2_i1.p1  ORF type:complete len:631 (-),score=78.40 TRINITY_DN230_c1_g2_i1:21-1913(-)
MAWSQVWLVILSVILVAESRSFFIQNDQFYKDGYPFVIVASNFHYFRVPTRYWQDRLERLVALGVNAIELYVPWNYHNPAPDSYYFDGNGDLEAFLDLLNDYGFVVLLRPGPYICAEWDFGGFPGWLLSVEPPVTLRTYEVGYMIQVEKWWSVLFQRLKKHLFSNGGPIVMVQMENEYGSYGNVHDNPLDKKYIQALITIARHHLGNNVTLYTTDSPRGLITGTLPGPEVFSVVDFGPSTDPVVAFAEQAQYNPPGMSPKLCSEFYSGWLTRWGEKIANTSSTEFANALDKLLSMNASVSIYMGHGGTNFGFWGGANYEGYYKSQITSYDYDAPVSEDGSHGYGSDNVDKFIATRDVLQKYSRVPFPPGPPPNKVVSYGQVTMTEYAPFVENINNLCISQQRTDQPMTMEYFGQNFGFILYTNTIPNQETEAPTNVVGVYNLKDMGYLFVNNTYQGKYTRVSDSDKPLLLNAEGSSGQTISVLVENLGRVNYGHHMQYERKGITDLSWNGKVVRGDWLVCNLPFTMLQLINIQYKSITPQPSNTNPAFYRGYFNIASGPYDTYVQTKLWGRGVIWVNGVNIGRYANVGPQFTLYIPAPYLTLNRNELVFFELEAPPANFSTSFSDHHIWN